MSDQKNFSRKIFLFMTVIAAALFLTGCTWFGGEEESESVSDSTVDEVTVVDDDSEEEDVPEEVDLVEEVEEDIDQEEEEAEQEDLDEEDEDQEEVSETGESVGTAMSSNGAVINAYAYEVANGKLNFSWKVSSTNGDYPKATIMRMENNHIVVQFPSLSRDSVAKEEKTNTLGGNLPDLTWMPSGEGSKYEFEYESEKGFMLKTEDRGEDGKFIVAVIDF